MSDPGKTGKVGRLGVPYGSVIADTLIYDFGKFEPSIKSSGVNCLQVTACPLYSNFENAVLAISEKHNIAKADNNLYIATSHEDLKRTVENGKVAIILGTQNAKPIEDDINKLHVLWNLGIRVLQLTYNERNYLGDGCLEDNDGGLSRFGRDVVREMNNIGMLIDLSHVGTKAAWEAIKLSKFPVLFTHANPSSLTVNPRNKSDDLIKALAETGGLIGLSTWGPVCWDPESGRKPSMDRFVEHVKYVIDLVGVDHICIGTDSPVGVDISEVKKLIGYVNNNYAGVVSKYNQTIGANLENRYAGGDIGINGFPAIANALLDAGLKKNEVLQILGGNFSRIFKTVCN